MEPIYIIASLVVGVLAGLAITRFVITGKAQRTRESAVRVLADAEKQAETMKKERLLEAKDEVFQLRAQAETDAKERRKEITALENRLLQREESIERRAESLDKREHQLSSQAGQILKREQDLEDAIAEEKARLESLAGMTSDEAKGVLLDRIRDDVTHDAA
ncbi:MAG TPA: Rnase Y domain-containing protein, partial [Coriobacteriia bacterium]|nr:Rnase Y domain-containing protein [Coriobacteriia bacterium]